MEPDEEAPRVRQILSENRSLREKVFELEEKLRKAEHQDPSSVIKLLRVKDQALEQRAAELEKTVLELEKRNQQLHLWMSTLRLYQEIFENEPSAMIGVNPEGRIVLFNRTAPQLLGEKFAQALHKPIEAADFGSFDPGTARLVREALERKAPASTSLRVRDRQVTTAVFPLGAGDAVVGAVVRISVAPAR